MQHELRSRHNRLSVRYVKRILCFREKNLKFNEALQRLESDHKCQSLSLHSFLMLPMQRITRLPLLVDAILSKMDPKENLLEYQMCEYTLASLNTVSSVEKRRVYRCVEFLQYISVRFPSLF